MLLHRLSDQELAQLYGLLLTRVSRRPALPPPSRTWEPRCWQYQQPNPDHTRIVVLGRDR